MQVGIYARISSDPRGEALGVTRQLEDCTEVAKEAGWEVAEVYTDNDASATTGKPRPEYRRMLNDVKAGKLGAIIAWHPDRLYRVLSDLEELIKVVEGNSVAIRTVKAGDYDLSTPTGRMVARILGAVATQEGEAKSDRWRRSWRQRRELGQVITAGFRTFGYTDTGEVVEAEAERVRQMVADVLAGNPMLAICDELNRDGFTTTRGNPWRPNALRKLLRNPRIAGYSTYRGEAVGEGNWTPLVDRDDWRTVGAILESRSIPQRPRRNLLPGMVYCGLCEQPMIAHSHRGRPVYVCQKRRGGCGGVEAAAARVEEIVESYARDRLADDRTRRRLAEIRAGGQGHILTELDALQARLAEIDEQMAEPGRSVVALVRASDAVRERIDALQSQLAVAASPVPLPVGDRWPEGLSRRRQLVEMVIARVWLDPSPTKGGPFRPERVRIDGA